MNQAQKALLKDFDPKYNAFLGDRMEAFGLTFVCTLSNEAGIDKYPAVNATWLKYSANPIEHLQHDAEYYGFSMNMERTIPQVVEVVRSCGKYDDIVHAGQDVLRELQHARS